jgi:hypothetical protein
MVVPFISALSPTAEKHVPHRCRSAITAGVPFSDHRGALVGTEDRFSMFALGGL